MTIDIEDLISVNQAVEVTGMTEAKIRRLIKLGRLEIVRLGYNYLIPKTELDKLTPRK